MNVNTRRALGFSTTRAGAKGYAVIRHGRLLGYGTNSAECDELMNQDLETGAGGLSERSKLIGERMARKLFEARGNNSEAHVTEAELASMIAGGAEVALAIVVRG